MTLNERITEKLKIGLTPTSLEVVDESSLHAGHAGSRPGGETHFRVRIAAAAFNGLSRVAQHRLVNGLLAQELREGVHALAIETRATEGAAPSAG